MCGRVRITRAPTAVAALYDASLGEQARRFEPGDYSPGEKLLAVAHGENGPEATLVAWGLPASWLPRGELLRHARAETALVKTTFRDGARHRRCVVPVDAWFERGTRPGAQRGQHEIAAPDGAGTALAAIWWPGAGPDAPRRLLMHLEGSTVRPWSVPGRECAFRTTNDEPGFDRVFIALQASAGEDAPETAEALLKLMLARSHA